MGDPPIQLPKHEDREPAADPHLLIRRYDPGDRDAVWRILQPILRAGDTYALPSDMGQDEATGYWTGPDRATFVAEADRRIVGTYYLRANQRGGGAHVANCGYMTASDYAGQGVARRMCEHSMDQARERGFAAMQFNFVVGSNARAVRLWQLLGFEIVGCLPNAFMHPRLRAVDVFVMFRAL